MKYFVFILVIACGAAFSNCTKETATTTTSRTVPLDSCIGFTNLNPVFKICFDSVINDSRCPANANCIWEGFASIKLSLQTSTKTTHFILNTHINYNNLGLQNDTTIDGINIRLVSLSPYPGLDDGLTRYRAELEVAR